MDRPFYDISIAKGTRLARILGEDRIRVNSFHHQAVEELGKGLVAIAWASDGVIEAYETAEQRPFLLGIQFHQESLTKSYPVFLRIFKAFVEASLRRANREG